MVELIKKHPEFLKDEEIIDAITGANVSPNYDRSDIVQIFGMNEYAYGNDMGLTLTPTRILLYYIDEATNHQLRSYPITDIKDITISSLAFSKNKLVKLYMGESHVSLKTNKDEKPEGFITHLQRLTLSQPSRIQEPTEMSKMLMELKGTNGQLELYEDVVIIKRNGLIAMLSQGIMKGDKTIYLNQITAVQFKEAGLITGGYIQFTLPGGNENTGGLIGNDENTVCFEKKDNELGLKMKLEIERLIQNSSKINTTNYRINNPDDIRKYKELLDDGIITQEEFDKKKSEILGF